MPVKINIDKHTLETKVQTAWNKGLAILTEGIKDDCNQYCKYENGALSRSADTHSIPKEGKIIWQTQYARRQYWEIKTAVTTNGHPLASWKWCEVAKRKHKDKWEKQAQKLLEMNL
jgi:hypothetical protein